VNNLNKKKGIAGIVGVLYALHQTLLSV